MGGDQSSPPLLADEAHPTAAAGKTSDKLALIPLIFLIFFEVSGGPYGEEAAVGAAGPLFAILGFLIFPFIWSIPEALITAELATTFPGNGGFVIWAHKAFGPFWGSMMGSWKLLSGVVNLASYPILCTDYLKLIFPIFSSGFPRYAAILISTSVLSFLNYTGLSVVGHTAVCLGLISLSPFVVLMLVSIPKIDFSRWVSLGEEGVEKDWILFFNTLFWNLNFWDNVSTLAGEVKNPQKTFPKALFSAGILACLGYLIPLLTTIGATPLDQQKWVDGYFADLAAMIAGDWLKIWVEVGAVLSIIGLYEAQLSSCRQNNTINGGDSLPEHDRTGASNDLGFFRFEAPDNDDPFGDRPMPEWVAWGDVSDFQASRSNPNPFEDENMAENNDHSVEPHTSASISTTSSGDPISNGTSSSDDSHDGSGKSNSSQRSGAPYLFEEDVEFVGVELEGTEKAMERALKEGIVGEAGPLKRTTVTKKIENEETDDGGAGMKEFNDANYWRVDQDVAVLE